MKNPLLMLGVGVIGLSGCLTEQPITQNIPPKSSDGSSYSFVGMD